MALLHFLVLGFFIEFCKVDATKKIHFTTSHGTIVFVYDLSSFLHYMEKRNRRQLIFASGGGFELPLLACCGGSKAS
jgi:hypothetical protein